MRNLKEGLIGEETVFFTSHELKD